MILVEGQTDHYTVNGIPQPLGGVLSIVGDLITILNNGTETSSAKTIYDYGYGDKATAITELAAIIQTGVGSSPGLDPDADNIINNVLPDLPTIQEQEAINIFVLKEKAAGNWPWEWLQVPKLETEANGLTEWSGFFAQGVNNGATHNNDGFYLGLNNYVDIAYNPTIDSNPADNLVNVWIADNDQNTENGLIFGQQADSLGTFVARQQPINSRVQARVNTQVNAQIETISAFPENSSLVFLRDDTLTDRFEMYIDNVIQTQQTIAVSQTSIGTRFGASSTATSVSIEGTISFFGAASAQATDKQASYDNVKELLESI